jgi:hypothetical protein
LQIAVNRQLISYEFAFITLAAHLASFPFAALSFFPGATGKCNPRPNTNSRTHRKILQYE